MTGEEPFLHPLRTLRRADAGTVGTKAADLGELVSAGVRVPAGFVLDADAYRSAVDLAGVASEIDELWTGLDETTAPDVVERAAVRMQELVHKAGVPAEVRSRLAHAYSGLGVSPSGRPVAVAIRSCAVGGRPEDSFSGVHLTCTNVHGHGALIEAVVDCWASAVSFAALTYRVCRGLESSPAVAVLVQEMVPAQAAGVALATDPVGGMADRVVVEAAFGQGAVVVEGTVEPDTYVFRRPGMELVSTHVGHQTHQVVRGPGGDDLTTTLDPYRATVQVLSETQSATVAEATRRAVAHLGSPRAVEWAMVAGQVWILQAGPPGMHRPTATAPPKRRVRGRGACAGSATGPVRVLLHSRDRSVEPGDVVVVEQGGAEWLPALRCAAAVVVRRGGITCRTAVLAREFGVPCVVGADTDAIGVRDGDVATVDGLTGDLTLDPVGPDPWGTA